MTFGHFHEMFTLLRYTPGAQPGKKAGENKSDKPSKKKRKADDPDGPGPSTSASQPKPKVQKKEDPPRKFVPGWKLNKNGDPIREWLRFDKAQNKMFCDLCIDNED